MQNITFEGAFELLLIFAYTFAIYLLLRSVFIITMQRRQLVRHRAAAPALAGAVLMATLLPVRWSETIDVFPIIDGLSAAWSALSSLIIIIASVAIANYILNYIAPLIAAMSNGISQRAIPAIAKPRLILEASTTSVLAVSLVVILLTVYELSPSTGINPDQASPTSSFVIEANYTLPAPPLALSFRGERDGYISLDNKGIYRFEFPEDSDGELDLESVYSDIVSARGLVVVGDTLYVSSQTTVPCAVCSLVPGLLGTVVQFDILPSGGLANPRAVLTGLPVITNLHAVQGLIEGPDGFLYLSIGGKSLGELGESEPSSTKVLPGSIIRFEPGGGRMETYATGIRNIYDISFDEDGRLYGVDNDGLTERAFRAEEVLQIKQGAHYGYPEVGTFDLLSPQSPRTDSPIWVMGGTNGASGLEWAPKVGLGPGLLIGSVRELQYLPLGVDEHGVYAINQDAEVLLTGRSGYFTIVDAGPDGRLYVGMYGFRKRNEISILRFNN